MAMTFTFVLRGETHTVGVVQREPELVLSVDGKPYRVREMPAPDDDAVRVRVDARTYDVWRTHETDRVHLKLGGRTWSIGYEDPIRAARHHGGSEDVLRADMPGVVVEVFRASGDTVTIGEPLLTIESMKMHVSIVAPRAARIETVHVAAGDSFDKGAELVSLEAPA